MAYCLYSLQTLFWTISLFPIYFYTAKCISVLVSCTGASGIMVQLVMKLCGKHRDMSQSSGTPRIRNRVHPNSAGE
jgi:hypothetical protein